MNQKELNELKKNFTEDCGFMTINKIVSVYINPMDDENGPIIYKSSEIPGTIPQERFDYLMVFLKSVLKGRIGKGNKEYHIENEDINTLFEQTVYSRLNNEEDLDKFIENVVSNYNYVSPYALFISHFTYSTLKTSNKDALENTDEFSGDSEDNHFILVSICPIENTNSGLIYNDTEFINDSVIRHSVQSPLNGFLYPTFSDRTADSSSVLIYDKNYKKVSQSIVDVCGANFTFAPVEQKTLFNDMLTNVIGKDLDYELVTSINDAFSEKLVEQSINTEPPTMNKEEVVQTLIDAGVDPNYKEYLDKSYEYNFKDNNIDTSAVVNKKTKIEVSGFTITFDNDKSNLLRTQSINGKNCVVITIDKAINITDILVTQ